MIVQVSKIRKAGNLNNEINSRQSRNEFIEGLRSLKFKSGEKNLSQRIDEIVYGV